MAGLVLWFHFTARVVPRLTQRRLTKLRLAQTTLRGLEKKTFVTLEKRYLAQHNLRSLDWARALPSGVNITR